MSKPHQRNLPVPFFVLLFIPFSLYADISFPESLYIIHEETGYKILLGTSPEFIEKEFGLPKEKSLKFKFTSPDYELWDMIYNGFEIRYQTYDKMISSITVKTPGFSTSKNIKVGSGLPDLIKAYGNPKRLFSNSKGELIYQYTNFIKEISLEGEYTLLQFKILSNRVVEILLDIVSSV
jgi:hypothetical protein